MPDIQSPLQGPVRSLWGLFNNDSSLALSAYAALGFTPEFVLDFQNEVYGKAGELSTFDDVLNFSRMSAATYTDAAGVLQTAAAGVPRVGNHVWNGSAWVNEGYLHESEARTNLLTYSAQFDNAAWGKSAMILTSNAATAPDGTLTAYKMVGTSSNDQHDIRRINATPAAGVFTLSVYAKAAEFAFVILGGYGSINRANGFDLSTGTALGKAGGYNAADSSSIEDAGNGWYRCSIKQTTTGNQNYFIVVSSSNSAYSTGDGTSGIYLYGAQVEAGSTPSSYIPTTVSTVTRAADTLTAPAANLPWPTPNVIGPELVTNGDFTSGISGVTATNATIEPVAGKLRVTATSLFGRGLITIPTIVGKVYLLSATSSFISGTNTAVLGKTDDGVGVNAVNTDTNGTAGNLVVPFTATSTLTYISLATVFSGSVVDFDNVSAREIDPLSVSLQMDGTVTGDSYTPTRWYLNASNAILEDIGTTNFTFTQEAVGVVDTVTGGSFTSGINVPFNIASRHGSTFINGAVDGTALTADLTPTALPNLSATDMQLGSTFMGNIGKARVWADNLADAGIAEASA